MCSIEIFKIFITILADTKNVLFLSYLVTRDGARQSSSKHSIEWDQPNIIAVTNHTDNPENQKWGGRLQGNASVMSSLASKTFKMAPNVEFFIGPSFRDFKGIVGLIFRDLEQVLGLSFWNTPCHSPIQPKSALLYSDLEGSVDSYRYYYY